VQVLPPPTAKQIGALEGKQQVAEYPFGLSTQVSIAAPGYWAHTFIAPAHVGGSHVDVPPVAPVPGSGGAVPPLDVPPPFGAPVAVHPNAVCTVAQVLPTISVTIA
jgi:hypothetical protein